MFSKGFFENNQFKNCKNEENNEYNLFNDRSFNQNIFKESNLKNKLEAKNNSTFSNKAKVYFKLEIFQ